VMALSSDVPISALASEFGSENRSCIVDAGKLNNVGDTSFSEGLDLRVSRTNFD